MWGLRNGSSSRQLLLVNGGICKDVACYVPTSRLFRGALKLLTLVLLVGVLSGCAVRNVRPMPTRTPAPTPYIPPTAVPEVSCDDNVALDAWLRISEEVVFDVKPLIEREIEAGDSVNDAVQTIFQARDQLDAVTVVPTCALPTHRLLLDTLGIAGDGLVAASQGEVSASTVGLAQAVTNMVSVEGELDRLRERWRRQDAAAASDTGDSE